MTYAVQSVTTLMTGKSGDAVRYTDGWRAMIEDHLPYIRKQISTRLVEVTPILAVAFRFDLAGLLNAMGYSDPDDYFVIMRLNGWHSPTEVDDKCRSLIIPDPSVIKTLTNTYKTQKTI